MLQREYLESSGASDVVRDDADVAKSNQVDGSRSHQTVQEDTQELDASSTIDTLANGPGASLDHKLRLSKADQVKLRYVSTVIR